MTTKDIRTHHAHAQCDVCGRTLLRGERAETYINGGARREVCELCKPRALHEGWVREGTLPDYDGATGSSERRRSLIGRLRGRRDAAPLDDELAQPAPPRRRQAPSHQRERIEVPEAREPRHVRAVPTSDEQKIIAAAELFNGCEHRRTVSGVSRSLGAPAVRIAPAGERPSVVHIVVSWELCWYRYEVDLSDAVPAVRVDGQGYELSELTESERTPNALADDTGGLHLE